MDSTSQFLASIFSRVREVAQQTVDALGEERANQFTQMSADGLVIALEIQGHYRQEQLTSLVNAQLWGLLKELKWLQVLFLAGNYPLVKGRLRYLWEAMYRAYFVETHEDDAVRLRGPDEKLQWIEDQKPRLDWRTCLQPALFKVLPQAETHPEVLKYCKELWDDLNQYVHPSMYLQHRLVDDSSLLVADNFDPAWAEDTLRAGLRIADLIWLAVLTCHEKVIGSVAKERLDLDYPLTRILLHRGFSLR